VPDQLARSVIGRLSTTIDRKERMRQMRCAQQAGAVRGPADGINRFVFEQKQFVLQSTVVSLLRDDSLLHCKGMREIHSAKPTHTEKIRGCRKLHRTTYDPQTAVQDAILSSPLGIINRQTHRALHLRRRIWHVPAETCESRR